MTSDNTPSDIGYCFSETNIYDSSYAYKMFDNSTGTAYMASNGNIGNAGYIFNDPTKIIKVELIIRHTTVPQNCPNTTFTLFKMKNDSWISCGSISTDTNGDFRTLVFNVNDTVEGIKVTTNTMMIKDVSTITEGRYAYAIYEMHITG